jgi:hypothetical protein
VRTRTSIAVAALLAAVVALPVVAAEPSPIDGPASAAERAVRSSPVATDVVNVFNSGPLRPTWSTGRWQLPASRGLRSRSVAPPAWAWSDLFRGSTPIQRPPAGFAYPMGVTALAVDAIGATMGRDVSALLAPDALIIGETSAGLRGARAGDSVQLVAGWGATVWFRVAGSAARREDRWRRVPDDERRR